MLWTNERIASVLDELRTPARQIGFVYPETTNLKVANVIETIRDEYEATLIEKNARIAELEAGIRSMCRTLRDDDCSCTSDEDNPEFHCSYCPIYLAHYALRLLGIEGEYTGVSAEPSAEVDEHDELNHSLRSAVEF